MLLIRSRQGVRTTPAGEALVGPLSRLVAAEDTVREAALASNGTYQGRVAVGGGSVTVETVVAPVVGRLLTDHPGLRFSVRGGSSADIEREVAAGDLDLAVVTTPSRPAPRGLVRRRILMAPLGVHTRFDHPLTGRRAVTWDELGRWPMATMRPGTVLHQRLRERLPDAEATDEATSARTVQTMVAQEAGVGLLARAGPGRPWEAWRGCRWRTRIRSRSAWSSGPTAGPRAPPADPRTGRRTGGPPGKRPEGPVAPAERRKAASVAGRKAVDTARPLSAE